MADALYDRDFHAWALEQADALRSGGPIDTSNVAEELEGLGKAQRTYLVNNLAVVIAHRLKWDYQPDKRSRSWLLSIDEHRSRVLFHIDDNPSLKILLETMLDRAYKLGISQAARETGMVRTAFPVRCPYTWDELMRPIPEEQTT